MNLLKLTKPTVENDNGDFRINRQFCSLLTLLGTTMSEEKYIAKLTTRESLVLLGLCLATGVVLGVLIYLSALSTDFFKHSSTDMARWVLVPYLFVFFFGPGTWFWLFGGFGVRGKERRAFILGGRKWFNMLAVGLGIVVFFLISVCHFLWS